MGGKGKKEERRSNVCMCVVQGCNPAATCSSVEMWLEWQVLVWVLTSFSRPILVFKLGMTLASYGAVMILCSPPPPRALSVSPRRGQRGSGSRRL